MTLLEIRTRLEELKAMDAGESIGEYSQRLLDGLPRMPFKELPLSLQREVRSRFTPERLWEFLQSCYNAQDFEAAVSEIPADDRNTILVRCRNIATYTIEDDYEPLSEDPESGLEKRLIPYLYGNHAAEAFATAIHEYQERQQARQLREQGKTKRQPGQSRQRQPQTVPAAKDLVSAGYYQRVISDTKYQHALTTQPNKNAYVALMQPDFFERLKFEDGELIYEQETASIIKKYIRGKYTDIQDLDLPLLTQIYTAATKSSIRNDENTITVSIPQFSREMGIETSKGNAPDIMKKLLVFEDCVGIMPGTGIIAQLLRIIQIDTKKQTMTFAVPYIFRLYEALEGHNHIERTTRKGEEVNYLKPFHNSLVHSTIGNEKNKTAVELVYLITNGLLQRGYVPDIETYHQKGAKTNYPERITYSVKFRTLINNAPLLRGRISSYNATSDKNKALRRAFEKAYQLIGEKTDAEEWFIDLSCNRVVPTMTTLDNELIFTHNGKNGDYKPKK